MLSVKSLIYGGCYRETCVTPHHDQIMGSGLRGSLVLCHLVKNISHSWLTWLSVADQKSIVGTLASFKNLNIVETSSSIQTPTTPRFHYLNPLASPFLEFKPQPSSPIQGVKSESALVFGTLESRPCIFADTVVYDPQSPNHPDLYFNNGSTASRCALVLNHKEAVNIASNNDIYAATKFLQSHLLKGNKPLYEAIVVKMAHAGCWVCTQNDITAIPAYETRSVFSIGSGDVFSAAFYAKWALGAANAVESASFASQVTANYCESGVISEQIVLMGTAGLRKPFPTVSPDVAAHKKQIYLAAPFFTQGEIAFVEHLRDVLTTPWTTVFSPLHDVGYGGPKEVYKPDIDGLERSDIVFAVLSGLDTGTIFEVGYACKIPKPVFCIAEAVAQNDLTMILGAGAVVETDVTTAVYKALWATLD